MAILTSDALTALEKRLHNYKLNPRSGVCYERKPCGMMPGTIHYKEHFNYERK